MIPYNGEKVKLVWADMDQYYVQTAEYLRDYRFFLDATKPADALSDAYERD